MSDLRQRTRKMWEPQLVPFLSIDHGFNDQGIDTLTVHMTSHRTHGRIGL